MSLAMMSLILFCVMAEAGHELCFKKTAGDGDFTVIFRQPLLWLGILLWGVEIMAWIIVLEHVPLTIAFPLMSLVYVVTVGGGALVLKEKVNLKHLVGALLITAGVAFIGATG